MNRTMFYLMSWVREKLEKKQINNETRRHWGGRREKKERDGRREEEEGKKKKKKQGERTWFEAPRQTGQRDLLKSAASVQSIV